MIPIIQEVGIVRVCFPGKSSIVRTYLLFRARFNNPSRLISAQIIARLLLKIANGVDVPVWRRDPKANCNAA